MRIAFLLVLSTLWISACGGGGAQADADDQSSGAATPAQSEATAGGSVEPSLGLPNERHLLSGLITGGMPDREALERARDLGVTTVISLRTPEEPGASDEQAMVEEMGMTFVSIPIAGAADLTEDEAREVDEAIGDAESTTVLHCASGNRAGAMVALRAFFVQGLSKEEALSLGREAGLTRLEDAVSSAMDAHCEANPDSAPCGAAAE